MINALSETLLTFAQAARRLPRLRNDRPVAPATLWRWASVGLRGVRLETTKVGGSTCTSVEALERFFAALNNAPVPGKPLQKRKQHDEAVERELAARGI
jgi:hypothetical protein